MPYAGVLLGAMALSAGLMPALIRLARRLGIVDHPTHRKIHAAPTPYLGGLGIVAGFVIAPALFLYFYKGQLAQVEVSRFLAIVAPAMAMAVLGLIDDKHQIRARTKLLVQIAVLLAFSWLCFRLETLTLLWLGTYEFYDAEAIPFTVAWLLGVVNGVNLVDGLDGLAGWVTAVIFGGIALLAINLRVNELARPDVMVAVIALAAFGATLGFLFFNWKPAKIYLGDSGSLAIGALAATLLIALGQKHFVVNSAAMEPREPYSYQFVKITLVAFYPLTEISLTIVRRLLRGKPIGSADKGHIHHRLMRWGWNAPAICVQAALMSAIALAAVLAAQLQYKGLSSVLLVADGILFGLLLHFCGFLDIFHFKGNRPHFRIANNFMAVQRDKLEWAQNLGEISALAAQTCIEFGVDNYALRLKAGGAQKEALTLEWSKPASAHGSILLPNQAEASKETRALKVFSDKVALASGSAANWTFEPHEVEDELDVEYRVLVSDFMRKAAGCAEYLYHTQPSQSQPPRSDAEHASGMSSTRLRRRSAISVRVAGVDGAGVKK